MFRKCMLFLLLIAVLSRGDFAKGNTLEEASLNSRLKQLIVDNAQLSIDKSIAKVGPVLFQSEVILPKKSEIKTDAAGNRKVGLLSASDKFGKEWFYAYTDIDELGKVFPEGVEYVGMNFSDFFNAIKSREGVGGIFINSGSSKAAYLIPAALFDDLNKIEKLTP